MYTPRNRPLHSMFAAVLVSMILTFATVAPVEAGTGVSTCDVSEVNSSLRPALA